VLVALATHSFSKHAKPLSMIVLGIDGMDPGFVQAHWNDLPNLNRLHTHGSFSKLGTTDPPQSPVAWASFSTGLTLDQHGIYDFVERDPSTLQLFSSFGQATRPSLRLPLGPYQIFLRPGHIVSYRRGLTFWQLLAAHGIPVTVIKMPGNYPPLTAGHELAGMGTPDLRGTLGTFTLYTDDPDETNRSVDGGEIHKVSVENGRTRLTVIGPPNPFRKDGRSETIEIIADIDPERPLIRLQVGDQNVILKQGEWSDWLELDFNLLAHIETARGIVRVFARQLHPNLQLYVSPVNVDPFEPALPIAQPLSWSRMIGRQIGPFFTLGIPEDTAALRNGVLNVAQFREQARLALDGEERLLDYSPKNFESGLLFYYFSSVDQNSHVFWGKDPDALLAVYQAIDKQVGKVIQTFPSAELIILSDHGFSSFTRAVQLNTWLYENGFLALKGLPGNDVTLKDADWANTQAYAIGLNAVYLNLAGREKCGIVQRGARALSVANAIRAKLLQLQDPVTGKAVIDSVAFTHPSPESAQTAPDLIINYAPGYRASWQTALGGIPDAVITDNEDEWAGDHCIDPAAVPGVFFTNRVLKRRNPTLEDVTATILHEYGVTRRAAMPGKSLY